VNGRRVAVPVDTCGLGGEPGLADATRTGDGHDARPVLEVVEGRRDLRGPTDDGRRCLRQGRGRATHVGRGEAGTVEALREEDRQVLRDEPLQLIRGGERAVGDGVLRADLGEQPVELLVTVRGGVLQVDELRHPQGQPPLVLEPGDVLAGSDPAVPLPVHGHEHVALCEVGAVELAGRVRPCAELEHHRRETELLDRPADGVSLVGELPEGRGHEHPEPLVRRTDARRLGRRHRRRSERRDQHLTTIVRPHPAVAGRSSSVGTVTVPPAAVAALRGLPCRGCCCGPS
jgi:hypothetical protein